MKIESPAFGQNESIPSQYTCDGADQAPSLRISGVPASAKTVAIIMDDPDAAGKPWVHWTVWNIPAAESVIIDGIVPAGSVEGVTSFGSFGYGGPCPPSGTHRYFFRAYALDIELDASPDTVADALERLMESHIIDKCGLVGLYGRE
jgi:Raf kinase inhibitor-like YbhB/YbcL family protein